MADIATVQDLLNEFRSLVFQDLNDTDGLNLVNRAHKRIVRATQVRTSTKTINLTAGTREYLLAATVMRIYTATYQRGVNDYYDLVPTDIPSLDYQRDGWRSDTTQSDPESFYATNQISGDSAVPYVGFDPIPGSTTSGGYPNVLLSVSDAAPLLLTDNLPTTLLNFDCYTYDVAWQWASRFHKDQIAYYAGLKSDSLAENVQHIQNLIPDDPPSVTPGYLKKSMKTI